MRAPVQVLEWLWYCRCPVPSTQILPLSAAPCLVKETPYFYTETVSSDYNPCTVAISQKIFHVILYHFLR